MAELRLIEQAQQGDPAAIAALMNQSLQPKGMTAFVERQGDALEVTLQADRVPNRQALTAFVEKGIHNLGITSIRSIRIMGQQTGKDFPDWMQELYLETSPMGIASQESPESLASPVGSTLDDDMISRTFQAEDQAENEQNSTLAAETDSNLQTELESLWNEQNQSQSEDFLQELMQSEPGAGSSSNFLAADFSADLLPDVPAAEVDRMSADPAGEPADFDALQNLFGNDLSADTASDLGLSDPDASALDFMGDAAEMPDSPPASNLPDPWTELTQSESTQSDFQLDADRFDALPESSLEDSGSDALLDDLFADTPTNPATTDEMGFESAAVSLTSVDDLLLGLDGEPDASASEMAIDAGQYDAGQYDAGQFDLDQQMADQLAADLDFESDQPQGSSLSLDDADASLSGEFDLFAAEETPTEDASEPVEAGEPTIAEEFLFADTPESDDLAEDISLFGSSSPGASSEMIFAMATEPLDVESLEFGLSASESLDANLVDEDLFLGEPSAESAEFSGVLDEMAAESEMSPEVALQDQWIESTSDASRDEFGLDNLALADFASEESPETPASDLLMSEELLFEESVSGDRTSENLTSENLMSGDFMSEQDVFTQEFPESSESSATLDFPADLFTEPASSADEAIAEELTSEELMSEELTSEELMSEELIVDDFTIVPASSPEDDFAPLAAPLADLSPEDDRTEAPDLDERLDLSGWFDNQIESGDPAAELSTAPSEDFLTREDLPGFTPEADLLAFTTEPATAETSAEFAELEVTETEPAGLAEFDPELNSAEAVADFSFENVGFENVGVASDEESIAEMPPEITQQQLEAQIANLFMAEEASATETGLQNSWEFQSDDVSDDSADNGDWSNALAFHLNEPAAEPVAEPGLTFESESEGAIAEPTSSQDEFQDLSFLTDMPGIDLPDDQLTPASTDSQFDEFPNEFPAETIADGTDLSLANTLSLSEAMHPGDLQADLQNDFQMDLLEEPQDDLADLYATDASASLEELSDEQLQELLDDEPEMSLEPSMPGIFASEPLTSENSIPEPSISENSINESINESLNESIVGFEAEPAFQSESTNVKREPLADFLNRQFGLEEEMPTVEELPEPVANQMSLEQESGISAQSPDLTLESNVQPTEIPFAAAPFAAGMAASSMASSPDVPSEQLDSGEPDLMLDLSEWREVSSTEASADLAAEIPASNADLPVSQDAFADVPPADPVTYYPTETASAETYPAETYPTETYPTETYPTEIYPTETYPTETVVDPQPVEAVSTSTSRPASGGNGIFTIILFSIVGFVAALLGFSLWSQITAPPAPETPAPTEPPAAPAPPGAPPATPAAPEASPSAPAPVSPAPAPAPIDPLAPLPPSPAPAAPPASPSPAV